MPDDIANFPLRDATDPQLAAALGKCHSEFQAWSYQAAGLGRFVEEAKEAGVEFHQRLRMRDLLSWLKQEDIVRGDIVSEEAILEKLEGKYLADQAAAANNGAKLARIVMLHTACEALYWRIARFGLVAKRTIAIERNAKRKVSVQQVTDLGTDGVVDSVLEDWWETLERQKLELKWDVVIGQFGMPPNTKTEKFDFTKDMLLEFDEARHDAVHHDARKLQAFDLDEFANQLSRFNTTLVLHVHRVAMVSIDRIAFFGWEIDPGSPMAAAMTPLVPYDAIGPVLPRPSAK